MEKENFDRNLQKCFEEEDMIFESIESACPYENVKGGVCDSCQKDLRGNVLLKLDYMQNYRGKGVPSYICQVGTNLSLGQLMNYNKVTFEEDIAEFNRKRKFENAMDLMFSEESRDSIHVQCNRVGNTLNEFCRICETDLEGNVMMRHEYTQFFPNSGDASLIYHCNSDVSRSRNQLGSENRDIVYEEDIGEFNRKRKFENAIDLMCSEEPKELNYNNKWHKFFESNKK